MLSQLLQAIGTRQVKSPRLEQRLSGFKKAGSLVSREGLSESLGITGPTGNLHDRTGFINGC